MEKAQPQSAPPTIKSDSDDLYEGLLQRHILTELVVISWIIFLWELYLTFRQRRLVQKLAEPPKVLDGLVEEDVYKKARSYSLDKSTFEIVQDVYSNVINTIFMTCWGFYFVWIWGKYLVEYVGLDPKNEIYVTAGCITVMRIYSTILCDLPFTVYDTFVLEQKHNFNNQTPLFFIKDQIIKFLVSQILMVPLICGMVWIVMNGGDYFFLYLWLFTVGMSLLLMIIYPELIAPLFDKYTPLPEGDLKNRIEALASSLNYPLYKLYIVEGSRRSSHSNAYLYGFYKYKRIVLYDTLVAEYQKKKIEEEEKAKAEKQDSSENTGEEKKEVDAKPKESRGCETDEIIAVLAHELGHWQHSHALQGFLFGQVIFLCNFISFAQLLHYAPIYEAFGFTDSKPVLIGLMVVTMYVLAPLNKLLTWALTVNSRRFEFQADRYAASLGHGEPLQRALVKLHKDNLGYPLFDKLYSNWHHSHPPLLERLDAIKKDV
ncbi:CAAX prenyl protease 1 homolog [Nasonia vitripennis]|uniref:CAAX prenyl protease n=1 Tax=Nasonia vitripennis TaxID=7425 RepID=A0A7M7QMY4_NASVI|nr:CAAX prenyl protease 1 homolog [Nasonia vitripennis]